MAQAINDDLDHEGVVVEKKIIPAQSRTSPLALIILAAFAATCAVVFFGGYIRMPADNAPSVTTPTSTAPATPQNSTSP